MIEFWNGERAECSLKADFGTEPGSTIELRLGAPAEGGLTLLMGLGKRGGLTAELVKRAAARAVKFLHGLGIRSAVLEAGELTSVLGADAVAAAAQGAELCLGGRNGKEPDAEDGFTLYIDINGADDGVKRAAGRALGEALTLVKSIRFARELVNCPANILTPEEMARRMVVEAEAAGIETRVFDEAEVRGLGMEAFLTVGTSAAHPAKLIVLRYRGGGKDWAPTALVGKGVTCDTGGYCLKPAASMKGIRGDMAGGAAVCGALLALAREHIPVNAVAVIPAAENRISPDSFIPGDVIRTMSGRSVEILNTDAEGRLMLADAVTYAVKCENAARIVDIATLTGAVVNMFGFTTAGYITNDESLGAEFEAAYAKSGEQYWRLPAFPEYRAMISSPNADLANSSSDGCGTITAGLFVGEFAEGKPWLHIDIAGTAWVDSPRREYQTVGATGAGTAALYELCRRFAENAD